VSDTAAKSQNNDTLLRELVLEKFEPIAIIGVGLRFPGGSETPEEFAAFLRAGSDGTGPIPADRWDVAALHAEEPGAKGKIRPASGGFISAIDAFDPQFFNISPKEANYIDPQHRLVLECAWKALEAANIRCANPRGSVPRVAWRWRRAPDSADVLAVRLHVRAESHRAARGCRLGGGGRCRLRGRGVPPPRPVPVAWRMVPCSLRIHGTPPRGRAHRA
jgi:Beta-ketoacyl synthase, N-terminal domain